jgi:c-di-GMP-related signal transduction protein
VLAIIATDPALSMRVLRASNSAAAGGSSRISSVRQAVVMIGLAHIRQWAMLMLIDDIAEAATEDQMVAALTRARFCENVAPSIGAPSDAAFIAGLVSGVAALLGTPSGVLAEQMPLSAEVSTALADGAGRLGEVLRVVDAYEAGDVRGCDLAGHYMEAIRWSARATTA